MANDKSNIIPTHISLCVITIHILGKFYSEINITCTKLVSTLNILERHFSKEI